VQAHGTLGALETGLPVKLDRNPSLPATPLRDHVAPRRTIVARLAWTLTALGAIALGAITWHRVDAKRHEDARPLATSTDRGDPAPAIHDRPTVEPLAAPLSAGRAALAALEPLRVPDTPAPPFQDDDPPPATIEEARLELENALAKAREVPLGSSRAIDPEEPQEFSARRYAVWRAFARVARFVAPEERAAQYRAVRAEIGRLATSLDLPTDHARPHEEEE
jgi:hypothetical protein